ncbi:MAG: putative processing protein DprA [Pseudomonadota bacterium]
MPKYLAPTKELLDTIRLIRSENVGVRTFYNLLKFYGSASNALNHVAELSIKGGRSKPIKVCDTFLVEKELSALHSIGGDVLAYFDPEYPSLLRNISDPPPVISYLGEKSIFGKISCSIVGARNSSLNGINFTKILARDLTKNNIATVSGLARGVDTAVHQASISSTIAVIAGGLDHIYPPENAKLYEQISKSGGAIVAELPVGSVPLAQHFPQRNRIISALSMVTIVIEASLKSGSLITARAALEQGREVGAVPGFPMDPRCQGTNKLIKEGAHLIESSENVLELVMRYSSSFMGQFKENCGNEIVNNKLPQYDISDLDRKSVIDMLSATPIDIDSIHSHTNLPMSIIYVIILELELAGKVFRSPGNKISILY